MFHTKYLNQVETWPYVESDCVPGGTGIAGATQDALGLIQRSTEIARLATLTSIEPLKTLWRPQGRPSGG